MLGSLMHDEIMVQTKSGLVDMRTGCRESRKICSKTAKTSLINVALAYFIGKSYGFSSLRRVTEVFSDKDPTRRSGWDGWH